MKEQTKKNGSTRRILERMPVSRVTETIVEQLEDRILTGELAVGDKLPSEQQLANQSGVGRRAIREALKALELKGLICVRKGSGAFVVRNDFDNYIETLSRNVQAYLRVDKTSIANLLQFRELLAGSVIGLLARQGDQATVAKMESALQQQERGLRQRSPSLYTKAHIDYHFAIVNSLQNPVVTRMYSEIMKLLEPYMKRSAGNMDVMRQSIAEHREILESIRAGDTARAHAAFHDHLESSLEHLRMLVGEENDNQ